MCHIVTVTDVQGSQFKALLYRIVCREDQEKKEQLQRKTDQNNHVVKAKGEGGFEPGRSSVSHSRATKKNETEERPLGLQLHKFIVHIKQTVDSKKEV